MNRTALITGTTSGIGAAFCNLLAKEKYNLILVARDANALSKQAEVLREETQVNVFCYDLSDAKAPKRIFEDISAAGLSVDILINNAAIDLSNLFHLKNAEDFRRTLDVNVVGAFNCINNAGFNEAGYFTDTNLDKELEMVQVHIETLTELTKLFLPGMIERGYGRILNMGSTGSYMPCPCDAVYAATKAYVLSFSNGLYQELKGSGVTVTCLCPGATQTRFAEKAHINNTLLFKIGVMQPEVVAKIGYKNMMRGKRTVAAGLYNKLLVLSAKLLPVAIINPIAQWMVKSPSIRG